MWGVTLRSGCRYVTGLLFIARVLGVADVAEGAQAALQGASCPAVGQTCRGRGGGG